VLQDVLMLAALCSLVVPGPRGPWLPAVLLAAVGVGLAGWAIAALGPALAHVPRPRDGVTRVRRGPYRFLRHPIYVGLLAACAGLAIRAPLAWLPTVLLAAVLALKARLETEWLASRERHETAA